MEAYKAITDEFSVAGSLAKGDIEAIKSMGFLTIISNLPDEEVENGFTSAKAKSEADSVGITYIHMPANGASVTDLAVVEAFAQILATSNNPVLAHCKSGTRSAILFAQVNARSNHPKKVLKQLLEKGFDLDFLEEEFEDQWALFNNSVQQPLQTAA